MSFNLDSVQATQLYYRGKPIVRMYMAGIMVYPTTAFRIEDNANTDTIITQDDNYLQSTDPFWGFMVTQQNDYLCIDDLNVIEYSTYSPRPLEQDVILLTQLGDELVLEYEQ